jgi:uncharacterized protein DUF2442
MKSEKPGIDILEAEVSNISRHGFWVFLGNRELFVSFREFPWFENAPISQILRVERPQEDISTGQSSISISRSTRSSTQTDSRWYQRPAPNMALQRTRRPRVSKLYLVLGTGPSVQEHAGMGRSLRSLGSPLNAYPVGAAHIST